MLLKTIQYLIQALLFASAHYLALAALAFCSYCFGRRLTMRCRYYSFIEQWSFSTTLGLGVVAYLVLFLGLVGALHSWLLLAVSGVALLCCYEAWGDLPRAIVNLWARHRNGVSGGRKFPFGTAVLLTVMLVPILIIPLYPPVAYDETMYHLPYAKTYVNNHAIVATPHLRFPVAPQTNEMLFTLALLVYDDTLAHLIELLTMVTLAAATLAFGRRLWSARVGWWSGAILLGNPVVISMGTCAYVDMGVALFIALMFYALWNWWEGREVHWILLAGIFCGLAVGTKLSAMFFAGLFGVMLLYVGIRTRRFGPLLVFVAAAFVVAAPWLIRSLYYTGNPVFPFFHTWIGKLTGGWRWKPSAHGLFVAPALADHLVHRGPLTLLWLPWRLAFNTPLNRMPFALFPGYFAALPAIVFAAIKMSNVRVLLGVIVAYTLFWYYTIIDIRYYIPVLPILSVVTAVSVDFCLTLLPEKWHPRRRFALTLSGIVVALTLGCLYAGARIYKGGPFPATEAQREAYLARNIAAYPAYQYLNRLNQGSYTLYTLYNTQMTYYANGTLISGPFVLGSFDRMFKGRYEAGELREGSAIYGFIRELGADYFLIETMDRYVLPTDRFFVNNFKLIYEQEGLRLYEVARQPVTENTPR